MKRGDGRGRDETTRDQQESEERPSERETRGEREPRSRERRLHTEVHVRERKQERTRTRECDVAGGASYIGAQNAYKGARKPSDKFTRHYRLGVYIIIRAFRFLRET